MAYQYSPLSSPHRTRILHILPGILESPIRCHLEELDLSTKPVYNALSYSWALDADGDDCRSQPIDIDGRTVMATRNLYAGLRRIRKEHDVLPLWVDALCIDQENDTERSTQVANMAEIYANAAATVIWLGESFQEGRDASEAALLSCLSCIGRKSPYGIHTKEDHRWIDAEGREMSLCSFDDPECKVAFEQQDGKSLSKQDSEKWCLWGGLSLITSFSRRRWFRRRWVVQEVLFSNPNTSTFYFGAFRITLLNFGMAMKGLETLLGLPGAVDAISSIDESKLDNIKQAMHVGKNMLAMRTLSVTLPFLLQLCDAYNCSDPRDRLYSMISMDKTCDIRADYSLSTTQTYTMFARKLIESGKSNLILQNARPDREESQALCLPSWVPDLRFSFKAVSPESENYSDLLQAVVNDNDLLSYYPYLLGTIQSVNASAGHTTSRVIEVDSVKQSLQFDLWSSPSEQLPEILESDLVCSTMLPTEQSEFDLHILRLSQDLGADRYRLVTAAVTARLSSQVTADLGIVERSRLFVV